VWVVAVSAVAITVTIMGLLNASATADLRMELELMKIERNIWRQRVLGAIEGRQ